MELQQGTSSGGSGDGTSVIVDGVSSSIRATVFDYANANPLAVVLRDTNGDYVAASGGTQYATNVAYADGNIGTLALTIRDDALTTLTEADGDYSGLRVDSTGRLWANVSNTVAVSNAGTFAVQAAQSGAWTVTANAGTDLNTSALLTTAAFNAAFGTAGTADTQVLSVQGIASMTPLLVDGSGSTQPISGTVTANQGTSPWVISGAVTNTTLSVVGNGAAATALRVTLANDSTGIVSLTTSTAEIGNVKNSGTFAVQAAQSGTWNITNISGTISLPTGAATEATLATRLADATFTTVLGSASLILATQADDVANTSDGLQTTSFGYMFDGSTWDRVRGTAADGLLVNLGSNNDVTVTGTVTVNAGTDLNTSALLTTAAFNAAFGTAGTADAQVLSVQGIASMTPLLVDGSGVTQPVSNAGLTALNGAISGTEVQVDVLTMPTVTVQATNLDIRDLASASDSVTTVSQKSATATLSNVAGSATSVTLLSAAATRIGATFVNDSTAIAYVKFGATATTTDYSVRMYPNDYYELPFSYTGRIDCIWSAANGAMRITELTP